MVKNVATCPQPPHHELSSSNFCSRLCFVCACLCFYCRRLCLTRFRVIELSRWGAGDMIKPPHYLGLLSSNFYSRLYFICACLCFYSRRLCLTRFRDVKHWRRVGSKDLASLLTNFLFHIDLFVYSTFV
jgi:hypothetical protein